MNATPQHHREHGSHHHSFDTPEMVEFAALEGAVLQDLASQAAATLAQISEARGWPVRRAMDIGSGPGFGTVALAHAFPDASVVAVDASPAMLALVEDQADSFDGGKRISTVVANLPFDASRLGSADVVWASQVLHHVDDQTLFTNLAGILPPGGLLAIIEPAGPIRMTPPDEEPGDSQLWNDFDAAWRIWFQGLWGDQSGDHLSEAGFEVVEDLRLTTTLPRPLDLLARRYATKQLRGTRSLLAGYATPDMIAQFDRLVSMVIHDDLVSPESIITADRSLVIATLL